MTCEEGIKDNLWDPGYRSKYSGASIALIGSSLPFEAVYPGGRIKQASPGPTFCVLESFARVILPPSGCAQTAPDSYLSQHLSSNGRLSRRYFVVPTPTDRPNSASPSQPSFQIDLYLIHSTSAFSVWCWLVLSILRYTAVFHPFRYRLIWRQPRHALGLLASASGLLELWIPFTVTYDSRYNSCSESESVSAETIQVSEHMVHSGNFCACVMGFTEAGSVSVKYKRETRIWKWFVSRKLAKLAEEGS